MVSAQRAGRCTFLQVFENCLYIVLAISLGLRENTNEKEKSEVFLDSYFPNSVTTAVLAIIFRLMISEFQEKIICILMTL